MQIENLIYLCTYANMQLKENKAIYIPLLIFTRTAITCYYILPTELSVLQKMYKINSFMCCTILLLEFGFSYFFTPFLF